MDDQLEPEDFYFNEQGLMVFTEKYLLKRGYCCESRCRHCPYGFSENVHKNNVEEKNEKETN
ncbi:hypothetical protein J4456_03555 [Candidatus Pacearchaeota archaeon]|nr:hypothetical protein [Candidatus Pacearchaeota archaeon]